MWRENIFILAVIACLQSQALVQMSYCTTNLKYGGTCVGLRDNCASGSFVYSLYSNYIGCQSVTKKCCANKPGGRIINPSGIEVTEPPQSCGVGSSDIQSRILNGILTGPCDWPFIVSIRSLKAEAEILTYENTAHACAGTLIDKRWVLTSAACVLSFGNTVTEARRNLIVVAGEYDVSRPDLNPVNNERMDEVIYIEAAYIFPTYGFKNQAELAPFSNLTAINSNGVALLKLTVEISGVCSGIACLSDEDEADNNCKSYSECVITGWGYGSEDYKVLNNELMLGRVQLTSRVACDFLTTKLGVEDERPIGTRCLTPQADNTDHCIGDGGGAVLCSDGYKWFVTAVIPFHQCRDGEFNMFYTDVGKYLNWIKSTIARYG